MEKEIKELIQDFEQDKGKRIFKYILSVSEEDEQSYFNVEKYYVIAKDIFDYYLVPDSDIKKIISISVNWSANSPYSINKIDVYQDCFIKRIVLTLFTDKEKEDAINMIKEKFDEYINKKEWYQSNDFVEKVNKSLCII